MIGRTRPSGPAYRIHAVMKKQEHSCRPQSAKSHIPTLHVNPRLSRLKIPKRQLISHVLRAQCDLLFEPNCNNDIKIPPQQTKELLTRETTYLHSPPAGRNCPIHAPGFTVKSASTCLQASHSHFQTRPSRHHKTDSPRAASQNPASIPAPHVPSPRPRRNKLSKHKCNYTDTPNPPCLLPSWCCHR